jgi:hypothetical protein
MFSQEMTPTLTTSSWFWFTKALLAGLLSASAPSAWAQTCVAAPRGLSAWYSFDEAIFAKANRIPGKVGSALRFNGSSDFFELPSDPGLKVGDRDFSVEAWIRTSNPKTIRNILDHRNFSVLGYLLFMRTGSPGFQVGSGGTQVAVTVATDLPVADGKWHHVVATVKRLPPQAALIYVDGVATKIKGKAVGLANLDHDEPAWLARHRKNELINRDNMFYEGDLDELSVYRRSLDPAEIKGLFLAGTKGKCKQPVRATVKQ